MGHNSGKIRCIFFFNLIKVIYSSSRVSLPRLISQPTKQIFFLMRLFYGLTPVHSQKAKLSTRLMLKLPIIWLNKWLKSNDIINLR